MKGVPFFLRNYLKKGGGGFHEYMMLRLQATTLALYVIALLMVIYFSYLFYVLVALLAILNFYGIFAELEKKRDHYAVSFLFSSLTVLAVILVLARDMVLAFDMTFLIIYFALFFLVYGIFHFKFRRNFTYGEVLVADDEWAVVKVPYDLCAGVRNGYYAVKVRGHKPRKHEDVKISLTASITEGTKPFKIIGKA